MAKAQKKYKILSKKQIKKNSKDNSNMIIFKIGSVDCPATGEELDNFAKAVSHAYKNGGDLVWHHAIDVLVVPKTSKDVIVVK